MVYIIYIYINNAYGIKHQHSDGVLVSYDFFAEHIGG